MLGINEGLSVPEPAFGGMTALHRDRMLAGRVAMLQVLGAGVVRSTPHTFPRFTPREMPTGHFDDGDAWLVAAGALEVIATIAPWATPSEGLASGAYLPRDLDAWRAWAGELARHYVAVDAWEIDNEPNLRNRRPPRGIEGRPPDAAYETPAEYAAVYDAAAEAIRAVRPDAVVVLGGIYQPGQPWAAEYLAEVLRLVRIPPDAISVHCYPTNLADLRRGMRTTRTVAPGVPVWVTETGWSAAQGEDEQARMLPAVIGALLGEGADRVLWHPLLEGEDAAATPGAFRDNALFAGGSARPAAMVFARLATALADVDPTSLEDDGTVLSTDRGWLVYDGTADLPAGATVALDLLTGETAPAPPTVRAPAWLPR